MNRRDALKRIGIAAPVVAVTVGACAVGASPAYLPDGRDNHDFEDMAHPAEYDGLHRAIVRVRWEHWYKLFPSGKPTRGAIASTLDFPTGSMVVAWGRDLSWASMFLVVAHAEFPSAQDGEMLPSANPSYQSNEDGSLRFVAWNLAEVRDAVWLSGKYEYLI